MAIIVFRILLLRSTQLVWARYVGVDTTVTPYSANSPFRCALSNSLPWSRTMYSGVSHLERMSSSKALAVVGPLSSIHRINKSWKTTKYFNWFPLSGNSIQLADIITHDFFTIRRPISPGGGCWLNQYV